MSNKTLTLATLIAAASLTTLAADKPAVRTLDPQLVQALEAGTGYGMAKAAELNGYPGPRHVLDLRAELALTPEQITASEALFQHMHEQAVRLGAQLLDTEREIDAAFAAHTIDAPRLHALLEQRAQADAMLRATHLEAHLAETRILSPQQRARYAQLRAIAAGPASSGAAAPLPVTAAQR